MKEKGNTNKPNIAKPEKVLAQTESEISVTPDVILNPNSYTLDVFLSGIAKHNDSYNAKPAKVDVSQDMINLEGGRADNHILLDVGSLVDVATTIKVVYTKGEKSAFCDAVYLLTPTPHWSIAGGLTDAGLNLPTGDLVYLTDAKPDSTGKMHHKKGDYIISQVECNTMRFKTRDVVGHLLDKLTDDFTHTGDKSSYDLLVIKLESKRADLLSYQKMGARIKKMGKDASGYVKKCKSVMEDIAKLESQIAQAIKPDDSDLSEDDLADFMGLISTDPSK